MDGATAILDAAPQLWEGVQVTLVLSLGGAALAFVLSIALGLADLSKLGIVRGLARVIVEFFRGTSLVVQIYWLFFVMPVLFDIRLDPMVTGILALGLNYGAYGAEVVRGSINAVPRAQWEGAIALSMTPLQRMRRVVWPQAWALMLPGYNNLLVMLVKGTSLASFVTLHDLTFMTQQMRRTTGTFVAFGVGLVIYYLLAWVLSWVLRHLEMRAHRRLGRGFEARPRAAAPPGQTESIGSATATATATEHAPVAVHASVATDQSPLGNHAPGATERSLSADQAPGADQSLSGSHTDRRRTT